MLLSWSVKNERHFSFHFGIIDLADDLCLAPLSCLGVEYCFSKTEVMKQSSKLEQQIKVTLVVLFGANEAQTISISLNCRCFGFHLLGKFNRQLNMLLKFFL